MDRQSIGTRSGWASLRWCAVIDFSPIHWANVNLALVMQCFNRSFLSRDRIAINKQQKHHTKTTPTSQLFAPNTVHTYLLRETEREGMEGVFPSNNPHPTPKISVFVPYRLFRTVMTLLICDNSDAWSTEEVGGGEREGVERWIVSALFYSGTTGFCIKRDCSQCQRADTCANDK